MVEEIKHGMTIRWHSLSLVYDLLFPISCIGCQTSSTYLCSLCLEAMPRSTHVIFGTHTIPSLTTEQFRGIIPAVSYRASPLFKEAIYLFKYKRVTSLARQLGELMHKRVQIFLAHNPLPWTVIPIPLHRRKEYARGFNQNNLLMHYCFGMYAEGTSHAGSSITLLCGKDNPLKRIRDTKSQTDLTGVERVANVKGVFCVTDDRPVAGRNILLVDDVITTGATMKEAAHQLINAGARYVWGCALAQD